MGIEKAELFFREFVGDEPEDFILLAQSGSARKNFSANANGLKYIITENADIRENESFFYFSQIFSDLNLNTPKVLKISDDRKIYIQQHLGENTLSEIIEKEELSERTKKLVQQTIQKLFQLQTSSTQKIDYSKTFEYENYDALPITNDLFYFKSFIADVLEIPYHKSSLLKEFQALTAKIEELQPKGLMIRDFQARNIMVNEIDEVFFIDYQAAMQGPLMYDVISFLFQAKANFPETFKDEMLDYYYSLYSDQENVEKLRNSLKPLQLIRFLQVLGAYGFRGLIQRKKHFIASIDKGIENLTTFSDHWNEMQNYPQLFKVIKALNSSETKAKISRMIEG